MADTIEVDRATLTAAKLGFKAHPHMLRHACGYALANKGHDTFRSSVDSVANC
jgi:site-specific recombinase XerD